ncbi:MAG TPA: thiamine pyrophosphate-binding protein [Gaiellaceae bacterium]|nr:thiamine pyrophosphate-binding protein [Gaiellaceae bacterium]
MAESVADFIVRRLREWGVRRIYGYPGDGINGSWARFSAPATSRGSSRSATRRWRRWMASGHAKFTGEVGVCLATSGRGAIHLLNGLNRLLGGFWLPA